MLIVKKGETTVLQISFGLVSPDAGLVDKWVRRVVLVNEMREEDFEQISRVILEKFDAYWKEYEACSRWSGYFVFSALSGTPRTNARFMCIACAGLIAALVGCLAWRLV
jgi:hypothetical protein